MRSWIKRPIAAYVAVAIALAAGGIYAVDPGGNGNGAEPGTANLWVDSNGGTCVRQSTPGAYIDAQACTLSGAITAASNGDLVLFRTGSYGSFSGTSKNITLRADEGQSPTMSVAFGTGDTGTLVIDGFGGMSGTICGGSSCNASNFTIRNSTFTSQLVIDAVANANITIGPGNTFNNMDINDSCSNAPARIWLSYGSTTQSGVTVTGNTFDGGSKDGIQAGVPLTITDNVFNDIDDTGHPCAHTDAIQGVGVVGMVVTGNVISNSATAIVDFDNVAGWTVTDNVCWSIGRGSCITLYSDTDSLVEHNTHRGSGSVLELDKKTEHDVGSGTIYRNNVGTLSNNGQGVGSNTHNLFSGASSPNINGSPTFVGGSTPTTWAGHCLSSESAGFTGSTTGGPVGIRC